MDSPLVELVKAGVGGVAPILEDPCPSNDPVGS